MAIDSHACGLKQCFLTKEDKKNNENKNGIYLRGSRRPLVPPVDSHIGASLDSIILVLRGIGPMGDTKEQAFPHDISAL